ncbi:MAG TPA: cytochrome c peroxidase [Parafilimonas sp.]|nr:cytochrome c peroxidase [Parafilimonas sp.]
MKRNTCLLIIFFVAAISIYAWQPATSPGPGKAGIEWVEKKAPGFIKSLEELERSLAALNPRDSSTLTEAQKKLGACRLQYKKISYLLEYYFPYEAAICNAPPAPDPEEDEVSTPYGLQVIESLLYSADPWSHLQDYAVQTGIMKNAIQKLLPLIPALNTTDVAFLQGLDLELVRIITLYVTGFDAPELKTGISEAYESYNSIEVACLPFCKDGAEKEDALKIFNRGKEFFIKDSSFNSFDRLGFLTQAALPLQDLLRRLMKRSDGSASFHTALDYTAHNLFAPTALMPDAFPHSENGNYDVLMKLGRKLFNEKALSKNLQRSCASCHNPDLYFTDGLTRNRTLNGSDSLLRNTPGLLYAGMQYMQFWDGRVSSIEEQVKTVLKNAREMGSSEDIIVERLQKDTAYINAFKNGWPDDPGITLAHVAASLSIYVRSLAPFSSAFDEYLEGNYKALTPSQQAGFNLFMGKAGCGKCHFAPVFNGLLPPAYISTEFEVTGMTAGADLNKPVLDTDQGRINVIPVEAYKGAFKTPTVRNAAVTGPYMHNGAFHSLETLMDFYNKGGGGGLGLNVPQQTLLPAPLNLTEKEKKDIIDFMGSLTDKSINK